MPSSRRSCRMPEGEPSGEHRRAKHDDGVRIDSQRPLPYRRCRRCVMSNHGYVRACHDERRPRSRIPTTNLQHASHPSLVSCYVSHASDDSKRPHSTHGSVPAKTREAAETLPLAPCAPHHACRAQGGTLAARPSPAASASGPSAASPVSARHPARMPDDDARTVLPETPDEPPLSPAPLPLSLPPPAFGSGCRCGNGLEQSFDRQVAVDA